MAPLSADEIVQKAVTRAQQVQAAAGQTAYSYTKATLVEQRDSAGKLKERKEKLYQIFFQGGRTHVKLLAVNGHAPSAADLKTQSDNAASVRQLLGGAKDSNSANQDNFLTPELAARFDFTLLRTETLNGRNAYEVSFQPKNPEPPQQRLVDRVLDRLSGTLWIDADEFEVARAQVQLRSEVELLGGVIGCLKKLAYCVTRTRVADGVWLNTIAVGDFKGRKLLESLWIKTTSETSNFHTVGSE